MYLDLQKVKVLLDRLGWSEVMFAQTLQLDYSYVYRILRGQRGIGKKFVSNFIRFCDREGISFRDYILFKN